MKTKNQNIIAMIIFLTYSVTFLCTRMIPMPGIVANGLVALVGLAAFSYSLLIHGLSDKHTFYIVLGIIFSTLMGMSIVYNRNASLDNLLWIWAYLGIALIIYEFDIPSICFFLIAFVFNIYLMILAIQGAKPADVLFIVGQNNISTYLIFFQICIYLSNRSEPQRLIYCLVPILSFVITAWTGSRAGMLATLFFLISIFIYYFITKRKKLNFKTKKGVFFFVLIAFIVIVFFVITFFIAKYLFGDIWFDLIEKIKNYGIRSIRTTIWSEYLSGAFHNIQNFIFGVKTTNPSFHWLSFYKGNTHNSFLMLHAKFGIIGFLLVMAMLLYTVINSIRKRDYIILITLGTVIIRSFFDWTCFPGLYDVIFWYFSFYCYDCKQEKNNIKQTQ